MAWGHFEDLNPRRFRAIMKRTPVAFIPFAMHEWHGEALPFGTDMFRARYTMAAVARRVGGIVMPTPWGTCITRRMDGQTRWGMECHARMPLDGNMCRLRTATFRAMVEDIYDACQHMGFELAVSYTSHLSPIQTAVLRRSTDKWNDQHTMVALNVQPGRTWAPPGDTARHADAGEAAEIKLIEPKLVHADRYARSEADVATGLQPQHASLIKVKLGRELQDETINEIARETQRTMKRLGL